MRSLSDEQLDRCRHLEKKYKNKVGAVPNFIGQETIGGDSGIKTEE
jgi:hypothetical protein